eukprot:3638930-Prymnesium_polylepis.1
MPAPLFRLDPIRLQAAVLVQSAVMDALESTEDSGGDGDASSAPPSPPPSPYCTKASDGGIRMRAVDRGIIVGVALCRRRLASLALFNGAAAARRADIALLDCTKASDGRVRMRTVDRGVVVQIATGARRHNGVLLARSCASCRLRCRRFLAVEL